MYNEHLPPALHANNGNKDTDTVDADHEDLRTSCNTWQQKHIDSYLEHAIDHKLRNSNSSLLRQRETHDNGDRGTMSSLRDVHRTEDTFLSWT